MNNIPNFLYRGDSDSKHERSLHEQYDPNLNGGFSSSGVLLTNLNNSGCGKDIFDESFHELVQNHVDPGWKKTHFLSFSENIETAIFYGAIGQDYVPYIDENNWSFILITLSLNSSKIKSFEKIYSGIYKLTYETDLIEFNSIAILLLLDVYEYFCKLKQLKKNISRQQFENAKKDKEWLILPINYISNGEFSCKMPTDLISNIDYYVCQ